MVQTLKLAWRNLWRNRRRTIITIIAISFGLMLLILSSSIGDGMHNTMIDVGIRSMAGHVVVQGEGYQEKVEVEIAVSDPDAVVKEMQTLAPDGKILKRIFLQGLLTSPQNAVGVMLTAVEPSKERTVGDLHEKLVRGEYLKDDDPLGLVIGVTLAETLDVDVGDKVVLMTQRQGQIENALFRVRGLFRSGLAQMDGFYGHVHLEAAQEVLGLGHGVTQVSLHLPDDSNTSEITASLRTRLDSPQLEVLPWQQALPELHQYIIIDDGGNYVFMMIIGLIVAMGIMNTVLMSVLERTREFGVLLAIGMPPARLGALVATEAMLLGAIAVSIGIAMGLMLNGFWLEPIGIDWTDLMGAEVFESGGVGISAHLYGDLSLTKVAVFGAIALSLTVISGLYPTWKATRLRAVDAMQTH